MIPVYTDELPIAQVKRLAQFTTEGTLRSNLAQAGYDVWVVQGFVQPMVLGQPPVEFSAASGPNAEVPGPVACPENCKALLAELQPLSGVVLENLQPLPGDEAGKLNINPDAILKAIQSLLSLLALLGVL